MRARRGKQVCAIALMTVLLIVCNVGRSSAQDLFREFPKQDVPTPQSLLNKLGSLQGITIPKTSADKLRELGEKILEGMPPEQQEFLKQRAKEYMQGRENEIPPELRGLAEDVERKFREQGQEIDFGELLKQLPNTDGNGTEGRSESTERLLDELRKSLDPENSRGSRPGNRSNNDSNGTIPDWVPKQLPREILDRIPGLDPSRNWAGNSGNNSGKSGSRFPTDGIRLPEGTDLSDWLNRQAERQPNWNRSPENRQGVTGPDGKTFEPAAETFQSGNGGTFDPSSQRVPGESAGNFFDRMILKVTENEKLKESIGKAASDSRFSDSVSSAVGNLINNMKSDSKWQQKSNRLSNRINESMSNRSSSRSGGSFWSRLPDFSGGSGSGGAIPNLGVIGILGGGFLMACLFMWFALRYRKSDDAESKGLFGARRFKFSGTANANELVQAVDRFLLNRFGKPSSWWHSRRAEVALNSVMPLQSTNIGELVDCYEYARYSEVGGALSSEQIKRCNSILRELAAIKILDSSDGAAE